MEQYPRRALLLSKRDRFFFFTRPSSATMLTLSALSLAIMLLPAVQGTRGVAFKECAARRGRPTSTGCPWTAA